MEGSHERSRRVMLRLKPDRMPLFDLLPNDAVLQHFNEGRPVEIGDDDSAIRALANATDASRYSYLSPMEEREDTLPDGRARKFLRWTAWYEHRIFTSSDHYREVKTAELAEAHADLGRQFSISDFASYYERDRTIAESTGDYYFLLGAPSPGLMGIHGEVGLEAFCYYLVDCEDVIIDLMEVNTQYACRFAKLVPEDDPFDAVFTGDDIAFQMGPMVNPQWLDQHYFPRLKRIISQWHARGKKVVFHSDGNLNIIMDQLVDAGIDALNPIEIAAGMDISDLHKRYPNLIFVGGIDASYLLPFGSPAQVRDAVVKAIEDAEGQILVGSSTEVSTAVPLDNFLAMRDAVMEYRI